MAPPRAPYASNRAVLTAFIIDFERPSSQLLSAVASLGILDVVHVPAVIATSDPAWSTRPLPDPGREIGPGAAGCLLAHRGVWRDWGSRSANRPGAALVLESDAVLTDYGRRWFHAGVELMRTEQLSVLQVGSRRAESWRDLKEGGVSAANRLTQATDLIETGILRYRAPLISRSFGWGTHAYLIDGAAAAWLARQDLGFLLPVDLWFRSLAMDPRYGIARVRQQLWSTREGTSSVDVLGR